MIATPKQVGLADASAIVRLRLARRMSERVGVPAREPPWPLAFAVDLPPDPWVLAAAAAAAVCTDLAVRSGTVGLSGAILVLVPAAGLLASGRVSNLHGRALIAAAPLFGAWLFVRSSPWLIPLDILASAGLLVLGASLSRAGSIWDLTVPQSVARAVVAVGHGAAGLWFALRPLEQVRRRLAANRTSRHRLAAVARGVFWAAPIVVVLGVLLASADAVFASFFRIDVGVDMANVFAHAVLLLIGAWGMGGLLRLASAEPTDPLPDVRWRMGNVEATIVLGSMVVLFGAFAVAQLVALSGGGRRVIETSGLTYAEYARSGFFQLLAVAAITLAVLLALRAATRGAPEGIHRQLVVLSELAVGLTLVIVFVSIRRMELYTRVFGLTMLRLYVEWFTVWMGAVFVLLAAALAGMWRRRPWLPAAAAGLGLALLFGLNAANPEAVVARHNVAFAEEAGRFDPAYLADLSDDAVPALVDLLPRMAPEARATVLSRLCPPERLEFTGWAAYNVSHDQAYEALVVACHP
jgi:hypothetical protein